MDNSIRYYWRYYTLLLTGYGSMSTPSIEQIQVFFEEALELPEQSRRDFLDKRCGKETELFREVISLLEADAQEKSWDSQPAYNNSQLISDSSDESLRENSIKGSRSYQWDKTVLQQVTGLLLDDLGPIASTLVRRSSKKASHLEQLGELLEDFLPDRSSRNKFSKKYQSLVGEFDSTAIIEDVKAEGHSQSVTINMTQIAEIEAILTSFIGPIAKTIVNRELAVASNGQEFQIKLAKHLHSEQDKMQFLNQAKRLLNKG